MLYFVVKQDGITDDFRYCGQPCYSEEEARELLWVKTYEEVHYQGMTLEEPVDNFFRLVDDHLGSIVSTYWIFKSGGEG